MDRPVGQKKKVQKFKFLKYLAYVTLAFSRILDIDWGNVQGRLLGNNGEVASKDLFGSLLSNSTEVERVLIDW